MIRPTLKGQRLVALSLLGCLVFNYPLLSLFAGDARAWGIPLLYVYLFSAWGLLIGAMAFIIEIQDH